MDDPWPDMYSDKYASLRIQKSVELARPWLSRWGAVVVEYGCYKQELAKYLPIETVYMGVDNRPWEHSVIVEDLENPKPHVWKPNIIFCLETLEHLKEPWNLLYRIKEEADSCCAVIISLPNESTLFHRLRCLFGVVDAEAFKLDKHVHLPSISQSRKWLAEHFTIEREVPYINPGAKGSRQGWMGGILTFIPDAVWEWLAYIYPSGFARGMIYLCQIKNSSINPIPKHSPAPNTNTPKHSM